MLTSVLANWENLGFDEKPIVLKEFSAGLNHYCGLIGVGNQQVVAKVFTHSFNRSLHVEYLACEMGVAPQIFSAADNVAVYQYIEDTGFNNDRLTELCTAIKKTHTISPEVPSSLNLSHTLDGYLEEASKEIKSWHELLAPLIKEFENNPTPQVFCHNDLVKENCLFNEQQAWLIDWEFAQANNPWFDLGSIILYFKLEASQTKAFLTDYFGHTQFDASSRIAQLAQLCVLWCDLLWHFSKHGDTYIAQKQDRFEDLAKRANKLGVELQLTRLRA